MTDLGRLTNCHSNFLRTTHIIYLCQCYTGKLLNIVIKAGSDSPILEFSFFSHFSFCHVDTIIRSYIMSFPSLIVDFLLNVVYNIQCMLNFHSKTVEVKQIYLPFNCNTYKQDELTLYGKCNH